MENRYLAKSNPEKTIKEHTEDLLKQYNILKSIYPNILDDIEWEILNFAIKYHDLGKINTKFQNKLYSILKYPSLLPDNIKKEEVSHNFLSTCFINGDKYESRFGLLNTQILFSSVYYHHDRDKKDISNQDIEDLSKQFEKMGDFYYLGIERIEKPSLKYILDPIDDAKSKIMESKKYIMVKGLLNNLDYVASLDKENVDVEEAIRQNGKTVEDMVKEITKSKYKNNYRAVQKYMMENQDKNLIVTSYTGSGKTEAALLWIGENKAFYTLPLKVSINAMYERVYNALGYRKALLLHSDAYSYYESETAEDSITKYDRAKKLSSPLIITTIDQLFKVVFKYKGYEAVLSKMIYSKIIIDEIQMYSPKLLAYVLVGLSEIVRFGGKFAIITATFPPILYNLMDKLKIQYTKQEEQFVPHIKNRHKIQVDTKEDFDYQKITALSKYKKVLIIANTVKRAQEIFDNLDRNANLLHSNYLKKHRNELEKQILEFGDSENKANGIWISTQIVEASLDIDFDVLFTELCSIDSLLQRMGRVFRKRPYAEELPNVYVLNNKSGVPYVIDEEIYEYTLEEILKYNGKNLLEADKFNIINNIFSLELNYKLRESNYYQKIKENINYLKQIRVNGITQAEVNKKFREIQTVSLIPDNIFDMLYEGGVIQKWKQQLSSNDIKYFEKVKIQDEIKQYVVTVTWRNGLDIGREEQFYTGSNIYRTRHLYDFEEPLFKGKGLIIKKVEKRAEFYD